MTLSLDFILQQNCSMPLCMLQLQHIALTNMASAPTFPYKRTNCKFCLYFVLFFESLKLGLCCWFAIQLTKTKLSARISVTRSHACYSDLLQLQHALLHITILLCNKTAGVTSVLTSLAALCHLSLLFQSGTLTVKVSCCHLRASHSVTKESLMMGK